MYVWNDIYVDASSGMKAMKRGVGITTRPLKKRTSRCVQFFPDLILVQDLYYKFIVNWDKTLRGYQIHCTGLVE